MATKSQILPRTRRILLEAPAAPPPDAAAPIVGDGGVLTHYHLRSISTLVLAIALVLACLAAVTMIVGCIYYRKSRRRKEFMDQHSGTEVMLKSVSTDSWQSAPHIEPPPLKKQVEKPLKPAPRSFTFAELKSATSNFTELIGKGEHGKVYKGFFHGSEAAVKKLESKLGKEEFNVEIETSIKVRSPYLLHLLGYCTEDDHMLLVYEYMKNGTLHENLFPDEESGKYVVLDWTTRMKIALQVAKGLEYLHERSPPIIHRDVRCRNVLLDDKLDAKLFNLGLAKVGSDLVNGDVSTRILGSIGSTAPEYVTTGRLTTKSDVFSFGVVLLALFTGQAPCGKRPKGQLFLADAAWDLQERFVEKVDPALEGQYSKKELMEFLDVAVKCVHRNPDHRPHMADVVRVLAQVTMRRSSIRV